MKMESRKTKFPLLFALCSLILASESKGENEVPVLVELRSPELGTPLFDPRESGQIDLMGYTRSEEPVQVSSVKLTGGLGNLLARNFKKPINSNWRDHYVRSSRAMIPANDEPIFSQSNNDNDVVLMAEDSVYGPILVDLEPVAIRPNSEAQRNHYLRTKKKTASAAMAAPKVKASNAQSHYFRSSRSVDGASGKKRQTTERDHFLRTVRSNSNTINTISSSNNNANINNNNGNSSDKKARDHYFRTVKRSGGDEDVDEEMIQRSERQLSAFNQCMKAAIENLE